MLVFCYHMLCSDWAIYKKYISVFWWYSMNSFKLAVFAKVVFMKCNYNFENCCYFCYGSKIMCDYHVNISRIFSTSLAVRMIGCVSGISIINTNKPMGICIWPNHISFHSVNLKQQICLFHLSHWTGWNGFASNTH